MPGSKEAENRRRVSQKSDKMISKLCGRARSKDASNANHRNGVNLRKAAKGVSRANRGVPFLISPSTEKARRVHLEQFSSLQRSRELEMDSR